MLLKILGSALVLGASSLIGNVIAAQYALRPREIRQLRTAFQILETEISYSVTPLTDALIRASMLQASAIKSLFIAAQTYLSSQEGYTAGEAWELAVNATYPATALSPSDKEILITFGRMLGASDREDQVKHLRLAQEQLRIEERKAEEEANRNSKMYRYLGFAIGATVVLLLA